ncbi:MAG TPA: PD-(D/E)XK nuclease family protein [Actinomycetota bacterium]|nr:PD-(D/E)XK nuclease family protein [Actinomycetota bacterium]
MTAIEIVSYSELDTYRQCPLKHQLGYRERWVSSEQKPALARGTVWHSMSEAHYRVIQRAQAADHPLHNWRKDEALEGQLQIEARQAAVRALTGSGINDEEVDLLWWMYEGYVKMWGLDPQWRIRAVEHNVVIPLREPSGRKSRFRVKAKIDLVVDRLDLPGTPTVIVDHKSGRNFASGKELDIDDQFSLYEWLLRSVGKPCLGSIHNAARTQRNKGPMALEDRFARTPMARGPEELDYVATDALKVAKATRTPPERRYSSPNPETCKWKCDFLDVHMAHRKGADLQQVLGAFGFTQNFDRH